MKLRALLALPLVMATVACSSPPPEPDAANREEAMAMCDVELKKQLNKIAAERELYDSDPAYYRQLEDDDYEKWSSTFDYSFLLPTEFRRYDVLRGYCQQTANTKHRNVFHTAAYVEYLNFPFNSYGESKVEKVYINEGSFTWHEE